MVVGSWVSGGGGTAMSIKSLTSFFFTCAVAAAFVLSAPAGALADCGDSILETAEQCDDGNLLEGDCCSSDCLFEPNGQVCDDGDPCSSDGTCSDGSCNATGNACDDGIDCTQDYCDPASGACLNWPDHGICDDGLFCNGRESCSAAFGCELGNAITCDQFDTTCNDWSCSEAESRCTSAETGDVSCDSDGDGTPDDSDLCPSTPAGDSAAYQGCSTADLLRAPQRLTEGPSQELARASDFMAKNEAMKRFVRTADKPHKDLAKARRYIAQGKPCKGSRFVNKAVARQDKFRDKLALKLPKQLLRSTPPISSETARGDTLELNMATALAEMADNMLMMSADTTRSSALQVDQLCAARGAKVRGSGIIAGVDSASGILSLANGMEILLPPSPRGKKRPSLDPGATLGFKGYQMTDGKVLAPKVHSDSNEPPASAPPINQDPFDCLDLHIVPLGSGVSYELDAYEDHSNPGTYYLEKQSDIVNATPFFASCPAFDTGSSQSCLSVSLKLERISLSGPSQEHSIPGLSSGSSAALAPGIDPGIVNIEITLARREYDSLLNNPCASPVTYKTTRAFTVNLVDYGGYCSLDYSETGFDLEDVYFNVGDPTSFAQFATTTLNGATLASAVPRDSYQAAAEGYRVDGGVSSFPSVQQLAQGDHFAVYRNHDFYPGYEPLCDSFWVPVFGLMGLGVTQRSGLRWPHVTTTNNGLQARYGCKLPDIKRDLLDLCGPDGDSYYRLPWYPSWTENDGQWSSGQANNDDPVAGHCARHRRCVGCTDCGTCEGGKNNKSICSIDADCPDGLCKTSFCSQDSDCLNEGETCAAAVPKPWPDPPDDVCWQRYAWDFGAPVDAEIRTARGGTAVLVRNDSAGNGRSCWTDDSKTPTEKQKDCDVGNYVFVRHEDGSTAVYWHMKENTVAINSCDEVRRGDLVGTVGNTGNSTGPHLHFLEQPCASYPPDCGYSAPVRFETGASFPFDSCFKPLWGPPAAGTRLSTNCDWPAKDRPCPGG